MSAAGRKRIHTGLPNHRDRSARRLGLAGRTKRRLLRKPCCVARATQVWRGGTCADQPASKRGSLFCWALQLLGTTCVDSGVGQVPAQQKGVFWRLLTSKVAYHCPLLDGAAGTHCAALAAPANAAGVGTAVAATSGFLHTMPAIRIRINLTRRSNIGSAVP